MTFELIRTARLILRPVRLTDAPALAARRNHPDVARWQTWTLPYAAAQADQLIAETAAMSGPTTDEWWMLTITDHSDTQIYGDVPIHLTWDGRCAEIGYSLAPSAWGRGYAAEAVQAVCARLFADDRITRISGMLHPDNIASAQVLERSGFVFEGHTRLSFWVGDDNSDDWIYGMTRAQHANWITRPRTTPADVQLLEIDHTNAATVAGLATHHSQEPFVAPVDELFRDAQFIGPRDGKTVEPWIRAVAADDELVGLVMVVPATETDPAPVLWRLLIDRRHQRRGIGQQVLDLLAIHCRAAGDSALTASWRTGRGTPEQWFLRCGFVPMGQIVDGEVEARRALE